MVERALPVDVKDSTAFTAQLEAECEAMRSLYRTLYIDEQTIEQNLELKRRAAHLQRSLYLHPGLARGLGIPQSRNEVRKHAADWLTTVFTASDEAPAIEVYVSAIRRTGEMHETEPTAAEKVVFAPALRGD